MTRALLPGRWNRHGRAVPDLQASEMDCEVAFDAQRVFPAPKQDPVELERRKAARLERVLAISALSLIAFGAWVSLR